MTYLPPDLSPQDIATLKREPPLRWSPDTFDGTIWGPRAKELLANPLIAPSLKPGLKLAEASVVGADAIGSQRTYWILDPTSRDVGIWGVNVMSDKDSAAAQAGNYPMVTGFFQKIGAIPPPQAMVNEDFSGNYSPDF